MTDLNPCPSCREPLDHPSGDGCANMTAHKEGAMSDDKELIARLWDAPADGLGTENLCLEAADRIEALTEQLAAARDDAKFAEDELEMQEQEACMMENDYIKLEKERDALEAKLAKAVEGLTVIDALDPEGLVNGCSQSALIGLVLRMGEIARATLAEIKGESHE